MTSVEAAEEAGFWIFFKFILFILRKREWGRGAEGESTLASPEPYSGLDPTNPEIMT